MAAYIHMDKSTKRLKPLKLKKFDAEAWVAKVDKRNAALRAAIRGEGLRYINTLDLQGNPVRVPVAI